MAHASTSTSTSTSASRSDRPLRTESYLSSILRWLQLKKYQYEVTFSLYMLTPTEKFIFSTCIHAAKPHFSFVPLDCQATGTAQLQPLLLKPWVTFLANHHHPRAF
jgi:Small subunit of serine palmitoyltransferase-like